LKNARGVEEGEGGVGRGGRGRRRRGRRSGRGETLRGAAGIGGLFRRVTESRELKWVRDS
jgi:hypothetical protein